MDELPLDEYLEAAGCDSEKLKRQISSTKVLAGIAKKLNKWDTLWPWLHLELGADQETITRDHPLNTERQR